VNPARFSVRQPLLVNLFAIVLVAGGAFVVSDMSRESYPSAATGWVRVTTVLPGAGPEEVERLVTAPLEDVIAELEGVEKVVSLSSEGLSFIRVELDAAAGGAGTVADISDEVAAFRELPPEAEAPEVREEVVRVPTLTVAVRGDVAPSVLQATGRHLERRLRRAPGIAEVEVAGLAERQLRVAVDPERLHAAGLSLSQVSASVAGRADNLAAGTTDDGERQRIVRGVLEANTVQRLADIVVQPDPAGGAVHLRHVAEISDGYAVDGIAARVDGAPAVILSLHRQAASDAVRVNERVRTILDDERRSLADGVTVATFNDGSRQVLRTTETLYESALLGLFLVFGVLGLFMGPRNAAMAALGLPVALAGGALVMHLFGITINMLSLGALILCIGLVVDDAIVLIENIFRHFEEGAPRRRAAIEGTREVMWPVLSATVTTCVAFLPLLMMTGVLGEFFGIIPKVVVAVLVGSLIEALFILPSHMAELGGRRRSARIRELGARITTRFDAILGWALRRRKTTIAVAYLVFGALLAAALTTKDVVLITEGDVDVFDVRVRMPADSSVHATDRVLAEVERRLIALRTDDVEAIWTTRGLSRDRLRAIEEDYVGLATVALVPVDERSDSRAGRELMARATSSFDDLVGPRQISVVEHELGPPVGAPVTIRLAGDDPARLSALSEVVVRELGRVPGVRSIDNSEIGEKRELRVDVDEGRAALHGLTAAAVGGYLRLAFSDAPVATTLVDNERVEVVVGLDAPAHTPDEMRALTMLSPTSTEIALGDVAEIVEERRPNHIRRNDRRRGVRISAHVDESTTSQAANRRVAAMLAPLREANPDIAFILAGEYEETNESLRSLIFAFVLAVLLMFSVLAAQFRSLTQPFVVLAAIPLSLIGVTIGFFVSGAPIGLIALVGAVGLSGIVVNDSLVLVDFVNRFRAEGHSLEEAVKLGARLRLRPIVATSVTTIAGILPLALAGDDAPLLSPMAIAIAWGLTTATILTLIVVPCLYCSSESTAAAFSERLGPLWRRITGADDEPLPGESS